MALGVPERVGIAHEQVHVVAQLQEFIGVLQRLDADQVPGDVLAGPAGHDGDHALVGLAAVGELLDDLVDVHIGRQPEVAVADVVGQPPELHQIAKHAAVAQEVRVLQLAGHGGDGIALLDAEVDHLGAVADRGQEGVVHLLIADGHHADHQ